MVNHRGVEHGDDRSVHAPDRHAAGRHRGEAPDGEQRQHRQGAAEPGENEEAPTDAPAVRHVRPAESARPAEHRLEADDGADLPADVAEVVEVEREVGHEHAEPEEGKEVGDGDAAARAGDAPVSQEPRDGASRGSLRRGGRPRGGAGALEASYDLRLSALFAPRSKQRFAGRNVFPRADGRGVRRRASSPPRSGAPLCATKADLLFVYGDRPIEGLREQLEDWPRITAPTLPGWGEQDASLGHRKDADDGGYDMTGSDNSVAFSQLVLFVLDDDGLWRIKFL